MGCRPGPQDPARQGPPGRRRDPAPRHRLRLLRARARRRRRMRPLPGKQEGLPGLPRGPRPRLADRHRSHRRSMPPHRKGQNGHNRREMGPGRSRGHPQAPCPHRQRRLRRLLALPPPQRTRTHPPREIPRNLRPRSVTSSPQKSRTLPRFTPFHERNSHMTTTTTTRRRSRPAAAEVRDNPRIRDNPPIQDKHLIQDRPPIQDNPPITVSGILDVGGSTAFLRSGYERGSGDISLSVAQLRQYGLRKGDHIEGAIQAPRQGRTRDKYAVLARLDTVNGLEPQQAIQRPDFAALTPLHPQERLRLESAGGSPIARIIDLVSPIGKGQRGLIVSPPKAGKTMVLQAIAAAIAANHPEVHLMVVLVGERPEEVTDLERTVHGEVISATFDQAAE